MVPRSKAEYPGGGLDPSLPSSEYFPRLLLAQSPVWTEQGQEGSFEYKKTASEKFPGGSPCEHTRTQECTCWLAHTHTRAHTDECSEGYTSFLIQTALPTATAFHKDSQKNVLQLNVELFL